MQIIETMDVSSPDSQRFPPVRVGGIEISEDSIAAEMQYHAAAELEDAWHEAGRSLVIRELLLLRANELGLDPDLDEEARIATVIDLEMTVPESDEASCRRFFEANPQRFRTPTLLAVSHILLAAAPDDITGRTEQEETGKLLIDKLASGEASFAQAAKTYSACESRKQGGQLGQIAKGQTVEEFERVVWRLPEGPHNQLVESRYGWHIVRIDRRMEGQAMDYEQVKPTIRRYLLEIVTRRWLRQYLQVLAVQYVVDGVDLNLPESPLMQ